MTKQDLIPYFGECWEMPTVVAAMRGIEGDNVTVEDMAHLASLLAVLLRRRDEGMNLDESIWPSCDISCGGECDYCLAWLKVNPGR